MKNKKLLYVINFLVLASISSPLCARRAFIKERKPIQRETVVPAPQLENEGVEDRSKVNSQEYAQGKRRWLIDKIVARVEGVNVLHSDLSLPRVAKDGGIYTLEEAITEEIFLHRALALKLFPSVVDLERQVAASRAAYTQSGVTDEAFEKEIESKGLSFFEYKQQLARWMAVEQVKRAEIGEKIVISAQEIEDYCVQNPEYTDESYWIHLALVPKGTQKDFKALVKEKKLSWLDLGWIDKGALASDFEFVHKMRAGQLSKPFTTNTDARYKAIKLVDKRPARLKNLDERYSDVEQLLFFQKRERSFGEFEERLRAKALVSFVE